MRVLIRTDSSTKMGSGHVMRTLTLADELRRGGSDVTFITRETTGNLIDYLEYRNYSVLKLEGVTDRENQAAPSQNKNEEESWLGKTWEEDLIETKKGIENHLSPKERIDWMVVDHYSIDSRWESSMREVTDRIMVIDDLANRDHESDLLLDQNLHEDMAKRYEGLVPDKCQLLLGPEFALVRPEFLAARGSLRKRDGSIDRILLFFGGSDPTNETMRALKGLGSLFKSGLMVDVVVGKVNRHRESIREYCLGHQNISYHYDVDYMARLMADVDLFVGSGGTSTWERCCLGLPSIIIAIARNQEEVSLNAHIHGLGIYLGTSKMVEVEEIVAEIGRLRQSPESVLKISERGMKTVDGMGASKVAERMRILTET